MSTSEDLARAEAAVARVKPDTSDLLPRYHSLTTSEVVGIFFAGIAVGLLVALIVVNAGIALGSVWP